MADTTKTTDDNTANAGAAEEQQQEPHFEPVHKLENAVETRTGEEGEEQLFKM